MKSILYIEMSNFVDFPLGGHLSFAKHLTTAMRGEIDLVGISTEQSSAEGEWSTREISGYTYKFFNVRNQEANFKRPLVPARVTDYIDLRKKIRKILSTKEYDIIIVQTPEVLFNIPKQYRRKVCLIMPGVENFLKISRYPWARKLASFYDRLFFSYAKDAFKILAAADQKALDGFIARSKGCVTKDVAMKFPTRYDADIFKVMDKAEVRKELGIAQDELMLLTTGRLNWFKGWKYLIDAFKVFVVNHDNAKLYFVGNGEDEQKILDYVTEVGLDGKVVLAGVHPLPVVSQYLNAADIFVMGSYFEGWSTALVEAISCANPCVVTEFSSAHDLVKDGENGFVQCEREEAVFAQLMEKALNLDQQVIAQYAKDAYGMSVQVMRKQLNNILHFE